MFKRKNNKELETTAMIKSANNAIAKTFIMQEIKELKEHKDGRYQSAYIHGLIDMAKRLDILELNEASALSNMVYEIVEKIKANGQPIYRKKGCYEYCGYYILKTHDTGDGAPNWKVEKIENKKEIKKDITFTEAVKIINKLILKIEE